MKKKKKAIKLLLIGGGADEVNVRYACGFSAPDSFLFLDNSGEKHLVVSLLELGRAKSLGDTIICHTPDSLGLKASARRSLGKQALGLLEHQKLKRISVSSTCPVGVVRELEKGGIKVSIASDPLYPQRLLKTESEVRQLRASQRAAVSAMKTAIALIQSSTITKNQMLKAPDGKALTSEKVRHEIERVLAENDCSADEIIVAGGNQAVDPHERGTGPLKAHEMIVLDIFPCSKLSGYWGDITRTVLKGEPSLAQKNLYKTVLKAQKGALAQVKPGVTGKEIHLEICRIFEQAGYQTGMIDGTPQGFIHSTGHGVGLEIHESPSVSPIGGALEPGHVITIEPGLYYRDLGGVRIEDTIVVTETGHSMLAPCSKQWILP